MDWVLGIYLAYQDWINLIKDAIFLVSALTLLRVACLFIRHVKSRYYREKTEEIDRDLHFRERLEPLLEKHVTTEAENKIKDIAVRFVHWKNYPRTLDDDGFKFLLHIDYFDGSLVKSWIDNTGVFF